MRPLYLPCPKCHQLKLAVYGEDTKRFSEKSKIKCYNPLCDYELPISDPNFLVEDLLKDKLKRDLIEKEKPRDEFRLSDPDSYKVSDLMVHRQDVLQPDINLFPEVRRLRPDLFPGGFPQVPGFYRIAYEPDEGERKALFWGSFIVSSIIIIGFLALVVTVWEIPWQTLTFGFLFVALLVSRFADILSTLFVLAIGGIETNPLSDPHDITKLLRGHGFKILVFLIWAYFLGQWKPWLGNGLLLCLTMGGFRAALSNITQILHIIFSPTSPGEIKALFYVNTVICSFIICGATYFVLPHFLP